MNRCDIEKEIINIILKEISTTSSNIAETLGQNQDVIEGVVQSLGNDGYIDIDSLVLGGYSCTINERTKSYLV
jgi:Mn-dependent DtxR family transcriptional regulator